ncbi:LysE family translocator [Desulfosediminicola sp.]|uniref:LysE family translocator n=1 Tax=Desulfosediminicola sp. TaxID=2886825 RepID=UPI003AF23DE0
MEFLIIATAHFLALLSPGPDFFLVMQASIRMPIRYGFALSFGIGAANGVYLIVAILGLQIIRDFSWLMTALHCLGAAYLIFIGIMLLKSPGTDLDTSEKNNSFLLEQHLGRQFLVGFMSGILNPKNCIFYLSLFTVMVSETTGFSTRLLYGLWMTTVVTAWDCALVSVLGKNSIKERLGRGIFYLEKVSGIMLLFFGLLLPLT